MMNKRKTLGITIIFIIGILLVAGIIGHQKYNRIKDPYQAFEKDLKQKKGHKDLEDEKQDDKVLEKNEEEDTTKLDKLAFNENTINILLLGIDSNEIRESERMGYRSDTIMLTSINLDTKEVKLLSIPRDTYTEIPGKKSKDKIAHAMAYGGGPKKKGSQYAIEAVENLLGIDVHYYVSMDMDAVKSIVDTIGGVTIDVERRMSSGEIILEKGEKKLNGEQALVYIRNRSTARGDFARIEQQQKFLLALFKQVKESRKLSDIIPLYIEIKDKIFTDLEIDQIGALALFLKDVDVEKAEAFILEGKGIRINGIYYLEIDKKQMGTVLDLLFESEASGDGS